MKDEEYIKMHLENIFSLIKEFFPNEKRSVIVTFIIYIMSITEIDNEYIKKCLNIISPEGGQITMTTAMKLRQEGIEEGIEQGIEQGELEDKHNVLIRLLRLKYKLTEEEQNHIREVTDFNKLDAALDACVFSKEKDSVLKYL